ncbi:MAG TPA: hypothetical protein VE860_15605 [Chthoniobacterales bacterium]|jgi:hypothetical protein|nr:hypothetical protein [Chthoniobacterales bacterium]
MQIARLNASRKVLDFRRFSDVYTEGLFGFVSPDANQWNTEVVGQKPDRVQNDALFTECASQNGMNLIDNQREDLVNPCNPTPHWPQWSAKTHSPGPN